MSKNQAALIILDGFGLRNETVGNAVALAKNRILTAIGTSILIKH